MSESRAAPFASDGPQIFLHLVVGANETDDQRLRREAEQDTKRKTGAAFEEIDTQFSDSETAVFVRLSERVA
jgi:hypothetical protein